MYHLDNAVEDAVTMSLFLGNIICIDCTPNYNEAVRLTIQLHWVPQAKNSLPLDPKAEPGKGLRLCRAEERL